MWNIHHLFPLFLVFSELPNYVKVEAETKADYLAQRSSILHWESEEILGGKIPLSQDEQKVNNLLMTYKNREIMAFMDANDTLPCAKHFFKAKPLIEESKVFHLIKQIPKGKSVVLPFFKNSCLH